MTAQQLVKNWQTDLGTVGLYEGEIDGDPGKQTQSATQALFDKAKAEIALLQNTPSSSSPSGLIQFPDIYHGDNLIEPFNWPAVLMKCSQGSLNQDPSCARRSIRFKNLRIKIGFYHYLDASDLIHQLDNMRGALHQAQFDPESDILCLDFEHANPQPTPQQAVDFIKMAESAIYNGETGRILVYGSDEVTEHLHFFDANPLWLAFYHLNPPAQRHAIHQYQGEGKPYNDMNFISQANLDSWPRLPLV